MEAFPVEKNYSYGEHDRYDRHKSESFTVSSGITPELKRVDISCESLKKQNDDRAFLLYNILTPDECKFVIQEAEKFGFTTLGAVSQSYRTNERVIIDSKSMSDAIWERIKAEIKPIILEEGDYKQTIEGFKLDGTWEPVCINSQWRLSKYFPGGHFAPHFDGSFVANPNYRSLKTFNLYLNGDFTGGSTNFVKEEKPQNKDSNERIVAKSEDVTSRVIPEAGMALVFNHFILHEGEPVYDNVKYLLRSDIMFRRTNPPEFSDDESKAYALLDDAKQLEDNGNYTEAIALYKKAFKLCPGLQSAI